MRILHVIANLAPRYGGPPVACMGMAKALATRGHEVWIYTTNQDGDSELAEPLGTPLMTEGVNIRFFPIQRPRFWGTSFPLARALAQDIQRFDVVHVHSLYLFHDWICSIHCLRSRVPYLVCPHGSLDPYLVNRHRLRKHLINRLFQDRAIRRAGAMHFITREEQELASPHTFAIPAVVVPIGLTLDEYRVAPAPGLFRARFDEIGDHRFVLFFGRLNFKKGLDLLIDAFERITVSDNQLHLVIAGPDNEGYGRQVLDWATAAGIRDRVTMTGMLQGEMKLAVLREAELFVLPSYTENFGIAVVEAMACGLPVVISDRVNLWHEVVEAEAGLVVPCEAQAVADAMLEIVSASGMAKRMGDNGQRLVEQRFQWSAIGAQLEAAYRHVIAGAGTMNPPASAG